MWENYTPPAGYAFVYAASADDTAALALARGAGTVAAAGEATAARDHMGRPLPREWLHFTVAVPLSCPLAEARSLAVVAAVFACDAAGDGAKIHWPNDVKVGDRRVCAVRCQAREGVVALTYAADPDALGGGAGAARVIEALAEAVRGYPANNPALMEAYCARCVTVMRFVDTVYRGMPLYGFAFAVDRHGGLMVMTQESRTIVTLYGGEATLARGEPEPPELPPPPRG